MVTQSEGIEAFGTPAPRQGEDPVEGHSAPAPMRIAMDWRTPDTAVVKVGGEVDDDAVPRLAEFLRQRLSGFVTTIVIDLSRVTFFDSAALELICQTQCRAVDRDIRMAVVSGGTGWFDRLLRISGREHRIDRFDSVPSALAGSGPP